MSFLFFLFFFLFSHGNMSFGDNSSTVFRSFERLDLPTPTIGPEGLTFDAMGVGPFASVSDGRVLKWLGADVGFVDFTAASPNRSKELCDGSSNPLLEPVCGRQSGVDFYCETGDLYFADSYHGLYVVGPNGGRATQLATAAEGVPFNFLDAVVVDQSTGIVYFTDASSRFQRRELILVILTGDMTGRLLKYDPSTGEVTVLLSGLGGPGGVAVGGNGSFLLFTEFVTNKIQRFWLTGPKADTSELFLNLTGTPDGIKRNERGDFWVAVTRGVRTGIYEPMALRVDEEGNILQEITFDNINQIISVVVEKMEALYVGSLSLRYVGVYRR